LGIKAYDIYGLSEIAGPGVGYECECQHGTHLNEDYFYPEILDPNTGEPLPEGTLGELPSLTSPRKECRYYAIVPMI
jgi:phenylacetate-CoA ligase